jgi:hypothetical protein
MSLVTANGLTAYDFQMRRPRIGAWHADMLIDSSEELHGAVALVIDNGFRTFKGTAVRTGEFAETAYMRVVAGAAGLGLSATPRHYNGASIGTILRDLARDAGEQLADGADAGVLAAPVDAWTTPAIPIGSAIGALLQAWAPAGTAWRMLADGTLWVGPETWPGAGLDASTYQIIDEPFEEASIFIHLDRPAIDPGSTFEGRRVSYVQDDVGHTTPVQCRVWFEDDKVSDLGRMREALAALSNSVRPKVDYRALYWGRVVAQSGGTVDVEMEDANVPGMGKVPLYNPAGMSQDGVVGGRVLVGWTWPRLEAYAIAFDGTETVGKRVIAGGQVFVGAEAGADAAVQAAFLAALDTYMSAIAGIADPTGVATAAFKAAKKTAHGFVSLKARVA